MVVTCHVTWFVGGMVVTHCVPVREVSWTLGAGSLWTSPGCSCLLTPPLIGEGKREENKLTENTLTAVPAMVMLEWLVLEIEESTSLPAPLSFRTPCVS